MSEMYKHFRDYYEKEAKILKDHQKQMYFGNPWNRYWHGTRLCQILKIILNIRPKNLLDVGCAEGYYIKLMNKSSDSEDFCGVGIDIAKNYLLKAKKKMLNGLFVMGDIHHLPFKNNCFDLVLCSEVLEHVLDPKNSLRELMRVSDNYILLTVAGENIFYYFFKKFGLIKPENPFAEIGRGHINELRASKTVIPWLLKAGCQCLNSVITCYFPISFLQKHRMPTFFLSIIKFADKLLNRIPIIKEYGSTQIILLKKQKYNFK